MILPSFLILAIRKNYLFAGKDDKLPATILIALYYLFSLRPGPEFPKDPIHSRSGHIVLNVGHLRSDSVQMKKDPLEARDDQRPGTVLMYLFLHSIQCLQKNRWKDKDKWIGYPEGWVKVLRVIHILSC